MATLNALTDIWNNVLTAWTAIKMNVSDSASSDDSKLLDLQINGASRTIVTKAGAVHASAGTLMAPGFAFVNDASSGLYGPAVGSISICLTAAEVLAFTSTAALFRTPVKVPIGTLAAPSITSTATGGAGINFFNGTSISFVTNGEERARFGVDGVLYYGQNLFAFPGDGNTQTGATISPSGTMHLSSGDDPVLGVNRNTESGIAVEFRRLGVPIGSVSVSGTTTTYNTTSDYRLKDRVPPPPGYDIDLEFGRLATDLTWFCFKDDPTRRQLGWMAHDFGKSVPLGLTGEKDAVNADGIPEYQMIDQSKSIPLIVARLDMLIQKVAVLEAQLEELRGDE
jgi:hypothetical protein